MGSIGCLYSGSDGSSGRAGFAGVGSTVRRNNICHMSFIPSEELERIKQTMRSGSWLRDCRLDFDVPTYAANVR
jgi:hypothetical protein